MKDITVLLDTPYAMSRFSTINGGQSDQAKVGVGISLTESKIRLGGRIS